MRYDLGMARGKWTAKIEGPKPEDFIKNLGLLPKGRAQTFIDSEMPRLADKFVPSDTTYLRKSVFELTDFGSGLIEYHVYHRNMYTDVTSEFQDAPMRGGWWMHRMWNSGGREKIKEGVRRLIRGGF